MRKIKGKALRMTANPTAYSHLIYMAETGNPVSGDSFPTDADPSQEYKNLSSQIDRIFIEDEDSTPTVVYRYYDDHGVCLYIGASRQFEVRDKAHLLSSVWRPNATVAFLTLYPWRDMAELVESAAIRHEEPVFNKKSPEVFGTARRAYAKYLDERHGVLAGCATHWVNVCGWGEYGVWERPTGRAAPC